MKTKTDPRHLARKIALQRLFERYFSSATEGEKHELRSAFETTELSEIDEITFYDERLTESIFDGVVKNLEKIDKIIAKYAPEWPIEQISRTDLQILRIAIYEGFISEKVPVKVAIDEAIELAKEFGGSASSKFVNGVLGALIKEDKETENDKKRSK